MTKHQPLPPDLAKVFGHLRHLQYKSGSNEWSSECPVCHEQGHDSRNGLPDRFHIHEGGDGYDAHGHCRRCGAHVWANQKSAKPLDPVKIKAEEELRRKYEAAEAKRIATRMDIYAQNKIWEYYHDQMRLPQRSIWRESGIPDNFQDMWRLGYTESYSGGGFTSPALTMPYFDVNWEPSSMQYRLLNPPTPNDRYRFMLGMHQKLWLPEPERELKGRCILTEGMKKGAVTFIEVVAEGRNHEYVVVSIPAASPKKGLLDRLSEFDEVVVAIDPDQYKPVRDESDKQLPPQVNKIVSGISGPVVKLAKLPFKADDFFTIYNGTSKGFMNVINQARQVKPMLLYS